MQPTMEAVTKVLEIGIECKDKVLNSNCDFLYGFIYILIFYLQFYVFFWLDVAVPAVEKASDDTFS